MNEPTKDLKPGTQIIYIPSHADGPKHRNAEEGFVTSMSGKYHAFCRYWSKFCAGLRTTCCSELTPIEHLTIEDTHPQDEVDELLKLIEEEKA